LGTFLERIALRYTCTHTVSVKTIFVFSQARTCHIRHASCNGGNGGGGEGDGVAARRALSLSPKLCSLPAETPSAHSFLCLNSNCSPTPRAPTPHHALGAPSRVPVSTFSSLSPSSFPTLRRAARPPGERSSATRRLRAPSRPEAPGHALCGAAALPHPLPAAELCQVCEEPARASAGHGEPPPSPPPPRAQILPELGSVLFPHRGRAWLLRRRGMADPLRRTLSRLRGRQSPRAAGGLGLRAAAAATVAASAVAEGDAGRAPDPCPCEHARGVRPSWEQPPPSPQAWVPEARVPGGRPEQWGALGPRQRGGKEALSSGRGLTRPCLPRPAGLRRQRRRGGRPGGRRRLLREPARRLPVGAQA
ncbi:translation initiation factor IF-2-like, partial [Zalophus californianus]|uniref:Translation initiation factor IF-2-like n=1 Tax=Zalophus californianus TaxID=9704 RepID=A0A6P9FCP8_ZALCA